MLRLKHLRKSAKMTQQHLATLLGITQATLSGWENEKFEIDINSVKKISQIFNVSSDYLLGFSDIPYHPKLAQIPVLGKVQAIKPLYVEKNIEDYTYAELNDEAKNFAPHIKDNNINTAKKLKELRKAHNMTQVKLAELLNISQGAITNWERGKTCPDFENLLRLADIYGISIDELLGRISTKKTTTINYIGGDYMTGKKLKDLRKQKGFTQVQLSKMLHVQQASISAWENDVAKPDFDNQVKLAELYGVSIDELHGLTTPSPSGRGVTIPVLGKVQAGIPIDAIEEILDYEEITPEMASQGKHFALMVRGDSMYPRFVEGDVVIVRCQNDVDTGDIAVILVNGNDATVKKIKKSPQGLTLIPLNAAYDYINYTNEDIERLPVQILGKVVELRGKF